MNRPQTMSDLLAAAASRAPFDEGHCSGYPHHWQEPAATERVAFEAVRRMSLPAGSHYVGFPWATLIDGLRGDAAVVPELLKALNTLVSWKGREGRVLTVAQHIHALQYFPFFRAAGITDVLWSHATNGESKRDGIQIHPFPLFPAQTPTGQRRGAVEQDRRYLANFVGAYNPKVYLTDVRAAIFADSGVAPDLLIIRREAWHFDRIVYEQQVKGLSADKARLELERRHTEEYLDAIEDSWFTLCPSGSGPNSIRIFESLCLGSIPLILTKSLRLPGPDHLWRDAAIIEEDSVEGYRRAVEAARAMSLDRKLAMIAAGARLLEQVGPNAYGRIIRSACTDSDVAQLAAVRERFPETISAQRRGHESPGVSDEPGISTDVRPRSHIMPASTDYPSARISPDRPHLQALKNEIRAQLGSRIS